MKAMLLFLCLIFPGWIVAAESDGKKDSGDLRQLLQRGLFEEEGNHDLEKASDAYGTLIDAYEQQRSYAATAIFRLAEIRAKGNDKKEAIELYQRVVNEFPNQDALVKASRERLAALGIQSIGTQAGQVAAAPTDEESKELIRLQEVAKNSPDNLTGDDGQLVLKNAVEKGWVNVTTFLLDHGAKPGNILSVAAEQGQKRIVELLLDRKVDINGKPTANANPLNAAAFRGRTQVAALLLERGADPNFAPEISPLRWAASKGNLELAKLLLEHGAKVSGNEHSDSPLWTAVAHNQEAIFDLLMANHADPNSPVPDYRPGDIEYRGSPLHLAVIKRNAAIANKLIAAGATIDSTDSEGFTPLHFAAYYFPEFVPTLLEKGADPKRVASKRNFTPLLLTAPTFTPDWDPGGSQRYKLSDSELFKLWDALLAHSADINAFDIKGLTLLHSIVNGGNTEMIDWLVKHGADLQKRADGGVTPISLASRNPQLYTTLREKYIFPDLIRAHPHSISFYKYRTEEVAAIDSIADFDTPPPLHVLLESYFGDSVPNHIIITIYSLDSKGELKNDASFELNADYNFPPSNVHFPQLHWGECLDIQASNVNYSKSTFVNWCKQTYAPRRVTVEIGDRTLKLDLSDNDSQDLWTPIDNSLPNWGISDLVVHVTGAEPRAKLDEIKLKRKVNGEIREWTVDLQGDASGPRVKSVPARLANGDVIVIPLKPSNDPSSIVARNQRIFRASSSRVFGEEVFSHGKDDMKHTLFELLAKTYAESNMVIPWPDFKSIVIHRLKSDLTEEQLPITLPPAWESITIQDEARKLDIPLEWGDIVEISQVPIKDPHDWKGFSYQEKKFLSTALGRTIKTKIDGTQDEAWLAPWFSEMDWSSDGPRFADARAELSKAYQLNSLLRQITGLKLSRIKTITVRSGENARKVDPVRESKFILNDGDIVEIERKGPEEVTTEVPEETSAPEPKADQTTGTSPGPIPQPATNVRPIQRPLPPQNLPNNRKRIRVLPSPN